MFFSVLCLKNIFSSFNIRNVKGNKIIFPYFPHQKEKIERFNKIINETRSEDFLKIDCQRYRTFCNYYRINTKYYYIFRSENKQIYKTSFYTNNTDYLDMLGSILLNNGFMQVDSDNRLLDLASKAPLFMLTARKNSGDLESKLPIFRELSWETMSESINLVYTDDPVLYNKYSFGPYSSFVYITSIGNHRKYFGSFELDDLRKFVYSRSQHYFGSPNFDYDGVTLAVFDNNSRKDELMEKYSQLSLNVPVAFLDTNSYYKLCHFICGTKCIALTNFKKSRIIPLNNSLEMREIEHMASEFEEYYKSQPLPLRFKYKLTLYIYFSRGFVHFVTLSLSLITLYACMSIVKNTTKVKEKDE